MKQFVRDYLTFNKRERNGLFVLIWITFLMFLYLNISPLFFRTETVDLTKFEKDIAAANIAAENSPQLISRRGDRAEASVTDEVAEDPYIKYFMFDPNTISAADWKRLGLTDKQVSSINKYRSKGGKFRSKADVKKMYCLPEKQYLSLAPYIQILADKKESAHVEVAKTMDAPLDINSADSARLVALSGIGDYYAKAILKYRNSLGGFVAREQLMEVWKFDSAKFQKIENKITVDVTRVKKININTCTANELKHPYLKWNAVNAICNYRSKHGKYITVEEIKNTDVIDEITYRKIAPYLSVE